MAAHAAHTSTGLRSAEEDALQALPDSEITSALQALPLAYRMAVYYADVEGLSCRQIAKITHAPVGTVTSRLPRGRCQLRTSLADVAKTRGCFRERTASEPAFHLRLIDTGPAAAAGTRS